MSSFALRDRGRRSFGGNPQRSAWSTRHKDLAALEDVNTKVPADKHDWERVGKASDCCIAGSMNDAIWQTK